MTGPISRYAVAAASALLFSSPAHAQLRVGVEPAVRYSTVSEYSQGGDRIVREAGWLPGIGAILAYHQQELEVFGSVRAFRADIDYDGKLQNGSPYVTDTGTRHAGAQFGVRYWLGLTTGVIVAFETDIWDRDIKGRGVAVGLHERTRSGRLLVGAERAWLAPDVGTFAAGASVIRAEAERVDIHFSGTLDDVSLRTRPATGYAIELKFSPTAMPDLVLGAQFDALKVRRGPTYAVTRQGVYAGDVAQPEHVRRNATIYVRYLF
ncbi:MAG TPA: hypothetical protein VGE12_16980 [Noviherbaspirillum sp.]